MGAGWHRANSIGRAPGCGRGSRLPGSLNEVFPGAQDAREGSALICVLWEQITKRVSR